MAAGIPPPPLNSPSGSYYWLEWYTQLTNVLNGTGYPWTALNFSSSNIHDIQTRHHNSLQNIQGGNALGDVTGGGNAWHLSGKGYVVSGIGTGMPSGWSVAHTSTGVYTITHNLGVGSGSIGALATSQTAAVIVQWIDLSNPNTVIVHTSTLTGTATDADFSFIIST